MRPIDHADKKKRGDFFGEERSVFDETGQVLGGFGINLGGVELDRIRKFKVCPINSEEGIGVVFGENSGFRAGDNIVRDAGDLLGLSGIDREGWDGMNFDHRTIPRK